MTNLGPVPGTGQGAGVVPYKQQHLVRRSAKDHVPAEQ
ncbi:hypothetical protein SAMN02745830_04459 [Streptomyces sp. Amel2xC10]|nr:hypothetical protein SAMN02745830_04459 [Streptomyces sp. Amel2xC10]